MVYLDEKTMPKDSEGSTGSSYIVDRKNRKVLIPIDVNKIEDIKELLGTLTEEVAHGKDALEGRQDKKVAEDKSNDEEGLETLGRPANEYVKKRFGEDLSLNTYKIPKKFQYNTLAYKYGELFGHFTISAIGILGTIIGSGMEGVGIVAAPVTGGVSLEVTAGGVVVETYSVGLVATASTNLPKTSLEIEAMKSEGGPSDNNSNKSIEDTKNLEKELEELKDGWGKGSFSDKEATIKYHYNKHKEEVGADSLLQYLRKAKAFSKKLRGAKKREVTGATKGVIKYEKNGKYIEIAPNGDIISFGTIK